MNQAVKFSQVSRHYGLVKAVDRVDLDIKEGEFFAMLGPSGSGKTTCLRLIGGFEQPTNGHIEILGEVAQSIPPYRRNVNTVFQDYALFPHMNVADNVAYGLMLRGMDKRKRLCVAEEFLSLVQLPNYGSRRTSQLSGGQRQRVALARALVNKPKVLLLDEPLGALDLKLREQMQEELKSLQRKLGITFIFVTHDQGEALSMADRVAVFSEGTIVQVGTPKEIYQRPSTKFVADFVGSSNVLPAEFFGGVAGDWASLRPEVIRLVKNGGQQAVVKSSSYTGASTRISLDLAGVHLTALLPSTGTCTCPEDGENVRIEWDDAKVHFMCKGK